MSSSLSVKLSLPTRVQPEVMPKPGKAGVYTNQMHYFKKHLLDKLDKKKFALDFMNPVDTEELQVPNYYTLIAKPMDAGTITKRVENNYYRNVGEAIADFKLIISNCFKFNVPSSGVYRKGRQLEKFFLRVIQNIPKGPPLPCNKDPMSTCKLKDNPMAGTMEQECRNQLRRLHTFTNQADATARNFFSSKWNSFSAKLDKNFFKSIEEFRSHVDGMFKKYHDPARMIYEKVYDQPGGFEGNGYTSHNGSPSDRATPDSSVSLSDSEVNDLLLAIQLTQNGLNQCLAQPQRSKSLAETFSATVAQFKLKLEAIKSAIPANNGENSSIVEEKQVPAAFYLPTESLEFLVDTPDAGLSDDDPKLDPIDEKERRNIQAQFSTLPLPAMREICGIVHSNEILGRDKDGTFTFDLNHFELANVHVMKAAVSRALKLNSKVNLRDMPPEEKEGLRCSLQSQLSNITERLNQNSRRKNAAPPASDKNKTNNTKNNGIQKRGGKRAMSVEPQLERERTPEAGSPPSPQTPEQTKVTKASRKYKKSTKVVQKVPATPIQIMRTPLKIPRTPGSWLPGGRISIKTPIKPVIKGKKRKSSSRVRLHVESPPAQPEPAEAPPAKIPKKVKNKKKVKTLADPSSDVDEYNDKDVEAPCSSTKQKAKKDKKKAKKSRLFLTPGNVLNNDLSLSSSSDEN